MKETLKNPADPLRVFFLEFLKDVLSPGACQAFTVRLNVEVLDDSVVDDHGEALATHVAQLLLEVQLHSGGLAELPVRVGEHADLARGVEVVTPGLHHVRIVGSHANHLVDPLLLELVKVLDVAGNVGLYTKLSFRT